MVRAISGFSAPPTETPMNTSAPFTASASVPRMPLLFVMPHSISLWSTMPTPRSLYKMPFSSQAITSRTPAASSILMMAVPAAPGPFTTTRMAPISFFTTRSAPSSAAVTTMAVPCWSSWNTGMSSSFSNVSSM